MKVVEIVKNWLIENRYDALYYNWADGDPCGCSLKDFMPCEGENIRNTVMECEAGHLEGELSYPGKIPAIKQDKGDIEKDRESK